MQFNRAVMLNKMSGRSSPFDFIIIGGGASGVGIALEAVSRGYSAILLEKSDFAKSTSGKSTKLVHGGVRYLAHGNISLVREACVERGLLMQNAPHLVRNQSFIIPAFGWFDEALYTLGLTLYDLMAGKYSLGRSKRISKKEVLTRLPTINDKKLTAGVLYHDGQFDDARLIVNVLQTAAELGAVVINYMPVEGFLKDPGGGIRGVMVRDSLSGRTFEVQGSVTINATGVFADEIMQMDIPSKKPSIRPSQGIHLVIDKTCLNGDDALMIPKTTDGRVLFAVPWHGKVILGTTDTPVDHPSLEPVALEEEIEFILSTAGKYLQRTPSRRDVLSVFVGLRPLAATGHTGNKKTREISRSHKIIISPSGLMTMIGGKWTTFRKMGEDMISRAEKMRGWMRTVSNTRVLKIHGYMKNTNIHDPLYVYGSDKDGVLDIALNSPGMGEYLSEKLNIIRAQVLWAVREEMAVNVEDVLSRRTRCQLLDARESMRIAPETAAIMAQEMGRDKGWISDQVALYNTVTTNYLLE